jgi:cobalt-zinc-cadmium resistance protein CzcA
VVENGRALHVLGMGQNFKTGGYHKARREMLLADRALQMTDLDLINVEILKNINHVYNDIHYWSALINKYTYLDSLYSKSLEDSERKMRLGENAKLAVLSSMAKSNNAKMEIELLASQRLRSIEQLKKYLLIEEDIEVPVVEYDEQVMILLDVLEHPSVTRQKNRMEKVDKDFIFTTKQKIPEISVSVFSGLNSFRNFEWYPGINIGTNIPLWKKYYKSAEESAQIDKSIEELRLQQVEQSIEADRRILLAEIEIYRVVLDTYYNRDRQMKTDLINYAESSFSSGEIDFDEFIAVLAQAAEIELKFLNNLYAYNAAVININYVVY